MTKDTYTVRDGLLRALSSEFRYLSGHQYIRPDCPWCRGIARAAHRRKAISKSQTPEPQAISQPASPSPTWAKPTSRQAEALQACDELTIQYNVNRLSSILLEIVNRSFARV